MTCADCPHPRWRHITGPRGCTGIGRGIFIVWCPCAGYHDGSPAVPTGDEPGERAA